MKDAAEHIQTIYNISDLSGVILNGIIGGIIARQKNFDIIGFLFLALFSALGGGMVRDVLIQSGPVAAIADARYLALAFVGAMIAAFINFSGKVWELFQSHADAVILGVWSVTGCVKALESNMPLISSIFLGVLTAVGGGMIRDVAVGETPSIFGGVKLYAVPSLLSATTMVGFYLAGWQAWGMVMSPLVGMALAITAFWQGWILPGGKNYRAPIPHLRWRGQKK